MLNPVSSTLSGFVASSQRNEATANNIANANLFGGVPFDDAGNPAVSDRAAYRPVRVEQSGGASADGSTGGAERAPANIIPQFRAVFPDQSADASNSQRTDVAGELAHQIDAANFTGNLRTVEAVSAMVRKLYDLG